MFFSTHVIPPYNSRDNVVLFGCFKVVAFSWGIAFTPVPGTLPSGLKVISY